MTKTGLFNDRMFFTVDKSLWKDFCIMDRLIRLDSSGHASLHKEDIYDDTVFIKTTDLIPGFENTYPMQGYPFRIKRQNYYYLSRKECKKYFKIELNELNEKEFEVVFTFKKGPSEFNSLI